jgi:hypothetical protein
MNITEIRDDMIKVYQALRNGSMKKTEADALANVAGKMIASAKLQLEYSAMRGEKPLIPFIGDGARPAINEPAPANGIELKP